VIVESCNINFTSPLLFTRPLPPAVLTLFDGDDHNQSQKTLLSDVCGQTFFPKTSAIQALERSDAESIIALFEDSYYVPRNAVVRGMANKTLFNIIHRNSLLRLISLSGRTTNIVVRNSKDEAKSRFRE
jgi:hypothetical protein